MGNKVKKMQSKNCRELYNQKLWCGWALLSASVLCVRPAPRSPRPVAVGGGGSLDQGEMGPTAKTLALFETSNLNLFWQILYGLNFSSEKPAEFRIDMLKTLPYYLRKGEKMNEQRKSNG